MKPIFRYYLRSWTAFEYIYICNQVPCASVCFKGLFYYLPNMRLYVIQCFVLKWNIYKIIIFKNGEVNIKNILFLFKLYNVICCTNNEKKLKT